MSDTAPSRRWLQFSLRTAFVVLTFGCIGLGYELNWIQSRHDVLSRRIVVDVSKEGVVAPSFLWLFGEPGYDVLVCLPEWSNEGDVAAFSVLGRAKPASQVSEGELARLQALFPEASFASFAGGLINSSDHNWVTVNGIYYEWTWPIAAAAGGLVIAVAFSAGWFAKAWIAKQVRLSPSRWGFRALSPGTTPSGATGPTGPTAPD